MHVDITRSMGLPTRGPDEVQSVVEGRREVALSLAKAHLGTGELSEMVNEVYNELTVNAPPVATKKYCAELRDRLDAADKKVAHLIVDAKERKLIESYSEKEGQRAATMVKGGFLGAIYKLVFRFANSYQIHLQVEQSLSNVQYGSSDKANKLRVEVMQAEKRVSRCVQEVLGGQPRSIIARKAAEYGKTEAAARRALVDLEFSPDRKPHIWKKINPSDYEKLLKADFKDPTRRAFRVHSGVILRKGKIRVQPTLSARKVEKQMSSLHKQMLSAKKRSEITANYEMYGIDVESKLTPLNSAFHSDFGAIHGDAGISSNQTHVPLLRNAWHSQLTLPGGGVRYFRHAILGIRGKAPIEERKVIAEKRAEELLKAAVIQQEEKIQDSKLKLNLASVSVVTPDVYRHRLGVGDDEYAMYQDQRDALLALENIRYVQIGDRIVEVEVNVLSFNYGTNEGALGKLSYAPGLHFGLNEQHEANLAALEKLKKLVNPNNPLYQDIVRLNQTRVSYQEGGNPFEVGAKIILLINELDEMPDEAFTGAINCMSNKDRNTVMDGTIRSLATMGEGRHRLSEKSNQRLFMDHLQGHLEHSGLMAVPHINTGVPGLKVKDVTLNPWEIEGFDGDEIRGLSKLTKA